jgi:hypothetical protein
MIERFESFSMFVGYAYLAFFAVSLAIWVPLMIWFWLNPPD